MTMASSKAQCSICNKEKATYICRGCSNDFCFNHLTEHRQILNQQLDEIENERNQFQQTIFEQKQNPHNCLLMDQINQWEHNSIHKIQETAEQCRQILIKHKNININHIDKKFNQLTEQLKHIREENEYNELDLNYLKNKLTQITQELPQSSFISVQQDSSSSPFIDTISIIPSEQIKSRYKWKQEGITIAGGLEQGNQLNQISDPHGIFIDNDKTIYIADYRNNRIVKWKCGENKGQVIAGGNRKGNRNDLLNGPTDLIVDKQTNSLVIADHHNRRVIRWSTQNQTNQQILISDIDCMGLTMDKNGFMYVCNYVKNEVRRWKEGETNGIIVAGGNGKGDHLNQLNNPTFIFVDEDCSLYVSDGDNHRVMKWRKNANEGIIVAGGNGQGNSLTQLSRPAGVFVNQLGQIYVADFGNDRVMCWCEGSAEGSIVVGGNGKGKQSNQLHYPTCLSFDFEENLYVCDKTNARIQKFELEFN